MGDVVVDEVRVGGAARGVVRREVDAPHAQQREEHERPEARARPGRLPRTVPSVPGLAEGRGREGHANDGGDGAEGRHGASCVKMLSARKAEHVSPLAAWTSDAALPCVAGPCGRVLESGFPGEATVVELIQNVSTLWLLSGFSSRSLGPAYAFSGPRGVRRSDQA